MMPMPMVQVGPVLMAVFGGFVFMPVFMDAAKGGGGMNVRVVRIVVGVVVPMRERIVPVGMPVPLAEKNHEGCNNDHSRQQL